MHTAVTACTMISHVRYVSGRLKFVSG